ncbi:MAG TPA: hypothetical protein VFD58_10710 [Blastocatellia bacterium]|nr:hypothetical protein [Blastocatellia bacterium]
MLKQFSLILSFIAGFVLPGYGCSATSHQNSAQDTRQPVTPTVPTQPNPVAQSDHHSAETGRLIWSGESAGYSLRWTTADLYVQSQAGTEKIFGPIAKKAFEEDAGDATGNSQSGGKQEQADCDLRRDFTLLSAVGTLVSFQDVDSPYCGGLHAGYSVRFTTIDLAKQGEVPFDQGEGVGDLDIDLTNPGRVIKLTDYFAEQDILRALLADRFIQKVLADSGVKVAPPGLAELQKAFAAAVERGYIDFQLRPDFLTRFVFHHIEGDKVAVRIGLPPFGGAGYHGKHKQLGVLLPIPPLLQQPLALAATRQQGFLMKDAPEISHKQMSSFTFKTGKGKGHK